MKAEKVSSCTSVLQRPSNSSIHTFRSLKESTVCAEFSRLRGHMKIGAWLENPQLLTCATKMVTCALQCGPEHILLGLLLDSESKGGSLPGNLQADRIKQAVRRLAPPARSHSLLPASLSEPDTDLAFSNETKTMLEHAQMVRELSALRSFRSS